MKRRSSIIILSILALVSSISVINGEWFLKKPDVATTNISDSSFQQSDYACYFVDNDIKNEFPTIEAGIHEANKLTNNVEVVVYPGGTGEDAKTIYIRKSFAINSNVTLTLPYEIETSTTTYLYRIVNTTEFENNVTKDLDSVIASSTNTNTYSENNMSLNVILGENVKITNKGTIRIAGQQNGANGGSISGYTTKFAQLTLLSGAQLINDTNSTLICFGYIVGPGINGAKLINNDNLTSELNKSNVTSSIINSENSKIYVPFVLVEHRGGTAFSGLAIANEKGSQGSPFNRFYFPNILEAVITFKTCQFYGIPDLHTGTPKQHNRCCVNLIGTDDTFLLQSTSFEIKAYFQFYNSSSIAKNKNKRLNSTNESIIKPNHNINFVSGDFYFNSLELILDVSAIYGPETKTKISTNGCLFPVSCYYSAKFVSGSFVSTQQKIKLLPGSNIVIDENYEMQLYGISVYDIQIVKSIYNITDESLAPSYLKGFAGVIDYEDMSDANCFVNGVLSSIYASGLFQNTASNGVISFTYVVEKVTEPNKDNANGAFEEEQKQNATAYVDSAGEIKIVNLEESTCYSSLDTIVSSTNTNHIWNINEETSNKDIYYVTILESSNTKQTDYGMPYDFKFNAVFSPIKYNSSITNIDWTYSLSGAEQSSTAEFVFDDNDTLKQSPTFKVPGNSNETDDAIYVVTATISFINSNSESEVLSNSYTLIAQKFILSVYIRDINDPEDNPSTTCYEGETDEEFTTTVQAYFYPSFANFQKYNVKFCWIITYYDYYKEDYFENTSDPNNNDDSGLSKINNTYYDEQYAYANITLQPPYDVQSMTRFTIMVSLTIKLFDNDVLLKTISATRKTRDSKNTDLLYYTNKSSSSGGDSSSSSSCILPDAQIKMADGSSKNAGELRPGDIVMSFNHETGSIEPTSIIANDHINEAISTYNVIHLSFDNGNETDFVYEHGYFDLTSIKYKYLTEKNYKDFIGHSFVFIDDNNNVNSTKLIDAYVYQKYTTICSPVTANNLNIISDNMLSIAGGISGLFNFFDYDPNTLAFDKDKMEDDIVKYGLLDYSYFKDYFPEEIYNLLPCKYMAVSIGKGLITWGKIEEYISKWGTQLLDIIEQ